MTNVFESPLTPPPTGGLPGPVLGIDTSGPAAVAVVKPDGTLVRHHATVERAHSEELTPLIQQSLADLGLKPADLAAIAVGTGPAPYTGLRIGLVTARTLAFALNIPVWGVSSLDIIASDAALRLHLAPGASLIATGDAKRHEVYWARYDLVMGAMGHPILELGEGPAVGPADSVCDDVAPQERPIVAGRGAQLYPQALAPTDGAPASVDPALLAAVAAGRAARGIPVPTTPLYLRRPDIMPSSPRKRATI